MNEPLADHVVIGSSLMARLLAGLLASRHGRKVVFVGESHAGYRLARSIDLSVAAITRPQSWAMLRGGVPETLRLLGHIAGRGAWRHVNPILFATGAGDIEALSHIRHMASSFGLHSEPAPSAATGNSRSGIILRDAIHLQHTVLEPALDRWMAQTGVRTARPRHIEVRADGSALLACDDESFPVRHAILADAEAIIAHLPLPQWPVLLRRIEASSVLTRPTRPLAADVMIAVDTDTVLQQQPEGGILGMGRGDLAAFSGQLQSLLGDGRPLEQVGQTSYTRLVALDGAPAVGRVDGNGADVISTLEPYGAFLAPALARWIAGEPAPQEADWFSDRLVSRRRDNSAVAEYRPNAEPAR
jgi:hypothetical protein